MKKKYLFIIILSLLIYIAYLQNEFLGLIIAKTPYISPIYFFFIKNFFEKTLMGVFLGSFLGGLFFIFLPIEVTFTYFITVKPVPLTIVILFFGNFLGLFFDFLCGRLFGKKLSQIFLKNKFDWFEKKIEKFGTLFLIFGHLIFFPMQIISVLMGSTEYKTKDFFIYTIYGTLLKFVLMIYLLIKFG